MRQRVRDDRVEEWHHRFRHDYLGLTADEHSATRGQDDHQEPEQPLSTRRDDSAGHNQYQREHDSIFYSTRFVTAGHTLDR